MISCLILQIQWWSNRAPARLDFPPHQLLNTIEFRTRPLFRDPVFLGQKYIVDGLPMEEIGAQTFSSGRTVRKHLLVNKIPLRPEDQRSTGPLPFGKKWKNHRVAAHRREQDTIARMTRLRADGLSYDKIASAMNAMRSLTGKRARQRPSGRFWFENLNTLAIPPSESRQKRFPGEGESARAKCVLWTKPT